MLEIYCNSRSDMIATGKRLEELGISKDKLDYTLASIHVGDFKTRIIIKYEGNPPLDELRLIDAGFNRMYIEKSDGTPITI